MKDLLNITGKYILKNKKPVAEPDLMKWAMYMENANRHIEATDIKVGTKKL